MPRERAQPLVAEIPLALRQPHDITPPGVSPLVEDADVALSLHFYFLTARIPLAAAQVQHLGSPERLAFGSAPLPRVAKKRPRHSVPFSLADLITRLRQTGHAPPCLMQALDFAQSGRVWLLLEKGTPTFTDQQQGGPANAAPPSSETPEAQELSALIDSTLESRDNVRTALLNH